MRDWFDQPEASGPSSETEDFSTAEFSVPGWRIGGPPSRDPAAEAILRNLEAEHAADLLKTAPPDALDLTVPVTAPDSRPRRPHRRTRPEPGQTPEDAA